MKIRNGFVSNSSSSSFMVFGVELHSHDVYECLKDAVETANGKVEDYSDWDWRWEFQEYIMKKTGLLAFIDWDVECAYIGRDPNSLKDDETGKEFRESVTKSLSKLFKGSISKPMRRALEEVEFRGGEYSH